jgi:myo-inositol catabolism protein IolC
MHSGLTKATSRDDSFVLMVRFQDLYQRVQTIKQLQEAGVEPDVWKIEGLDRREVREWLTTAAGVAGFIGFAVGRTVFWEPLVNFLAQKTSREAAVAEIAFGIVTHEHLAKNRLNGFDVVGKVIAVFEIKLILPALLGRTSGGKAFGFRVA